jgi:hypothetical protein
MPRKNNNYRSKIETYISLALDIGSPFAGAIPADAA